jgi:hypothetical protein
MWLIKFLPDWIFYGLLFVGLIGLFITYFLKLLPIPALYLYKTPIQVASIAAIVIGTFMSGAIFNEHAWLEKVRELEAQLKEKEIESVKENVKIDTKVITKTQVIKERGQDIVKYIDREVVKYDNTCVIPKEFIEAHNRAAENIK